jgi:parvulin-like peptidyl-prolyl isomerase
MSVLATVNGESVTVTEGLRKAFISRNEFLQGIITSALIRQYAEKNKISNTDGELQLAADEWRYQRGLESVEKLNQWMKANHQTILSLQDEVDSILLHNKVRNAIPESEIEAYFAEHQLEFEAVELYSCRLDSAEKAKELLAQINEENANFHLLTMEHSLDDQTKQLGGYAGRLTRSNVTGEVEAAVFRARSGEIVGPIKTEKGYNLFKVAAVHKPSLEKEKENIRLILFQNLLTKLQSQANIRYNVLEELAARTA